MVHFYFYARSLALRSVRGLGSGVCGPVIYSLSWRRKKVLGGEFPFQRERTHIDIARERERERKREREREKERERERERERENEGFITLTEGLEEQTFSFSVCIKLKLVEHSKL